jgi:hypothetical protein
LAPWTPWLIWVRGCRGWAAGDEMVDRSFLAERLRPLGLWWAVMVIMSATGPAGAGRKLGTHR